MADAAGAAARGTPRPGRPRLDNHQSAVSSPANADCGARPPPHGVDGGRARHPPAARPPAPDAPAARLDGAGESERRPWALPAELTVADDPPPLRSKYYVARDARLQQFRTKPLTPRPREVQSRAVLHEPLRRRRFRPASRMPPRLDAGDPHLRGVDAGATRENTSSSSSSAASVSASPPAPLHRTVTIQDQEFEVVWDGTHGAALTTWPLAKPEP